MATLRWLWSALTQPQPAELVALPDPQARGDRAALLCVAAINVVLLLLIGVTYARSEALRPSPAPAVSSASKEAA